MNSFQDALKINLDFLDEISPPPWTTSRGGLATNDFSTAAEIERALDRNAGMSRVRRPLEPVEDLRRLAQARFGRRPP